MAQRFIRIFEESKADAIVSPSGSCTAMVHHFPELFAGDAEWVERAKTLASRTHELSSFLVRVLKIDDVGASWSGKLTWHDACHGLRDLNVKSEPRALIRNVRNAEFIELENAEACCGFGGTFSVKYPEISVAILDQKIEAIEHSGVQAVVSGDASCCADRRAPLTQRSNEVMHLAELLASQTSMSHQSSETFGENAKTALADVQLRGALRRDVAVRQTPARSREKPEQLGRLAYPCSGDQRRGAVASRSFFGNVCRQCRGRGAVVHWAVDAAGRNAIICKLAQDRGARTIVKAKA